MFSSEVQNLSEHRISIHRFGAQVKDDLQQLRAMRLQLAEEQLASADKTIAELQARKLISEDQSPAEVRQALVERVIDLKKRLADPESIYADEVEFFLSFLGEGEDLDSSI